MNLDIVLHFQDGNRFSVPCASQTTILELKGKICAVKGIPIDHQLLELNCLRKTLVNDHLTLSDYGVRHRDIVSLKTTRLLGAPHSCDKDGGCFRKYASEGILLGLLACLHNGMRIDTSDAEGRTALMLASLKGYPDMVNFLIINGANPTLPDLSGRSSLFYGVTSGKAAIVTHLLQAGAPVRGTDKRGQTAADITTNTSLVSLIVKEAEYREALPKLLHGVLNRLISAVCIDVIGHYLNMEGKLGEQWSFTPKKKNPTPSSEETVPLERMTKRMRIQENTPMAPMFPLEQDVAMAIDEPAPQYGDDEQFEVYQDHEEDNVMAETLLPQQMETWECNHCTYKNPITSYHCDVCGS